MQARTPVADSKDDSLTWQRVTVKGDGPLYALRDGVCSAPDGSGIWVLGRARDASIGAWWFDLRRSKWRCVARKAITPPGWIGWGAIDPARGMAHFIGATWGAIGSSASFDLDLVTGTMTQSPTLPRLFATLNVGMRIVRDPVLDRLILFGGFAHAIPCNDPCWAYPLDPHLRDLVHPLCYDGDGPPPMLLHSMVFDTRRQRMLVIGGSAQSRPVLPLWALEMKGEPHWHAMAVTPADAIGIVEACAVYDSVRDAVWMLGGRFRQYENERGTWRLQLGDNAAEWVYCPARARWPERGTIMAVTLSRPGGDVVAFAYGRMGEGLQVWRLRIPKPAFAARPDTLAAPAVADTAAAGPAPAPIAFALDGAASEPLRGPLVIAFALPTRAPARLELFDVAGRRLVTREVGVFGPGRHAVRLDDERSFASGVYFVRLRDPAHSATRRVTLLR